MSRFCHTDLLYIGCMASTPYPIRIPNDELAQLKVRAEEEGVSLSEAMRVGALMYLNATPAEREARVAEASISSAAAALNDQVDRAKTALRSLGYE